MMEKSSYLRTQHPDLDGDFNYFSIIHPYFGETDPILTT